MRLDGSSPQLVLYEPKRGASVWIIVGGAALCLPCSDGYADGLIGSVGWACDSEGGVEHQGVW